MSANNGVIRIGRKGLKKFAFGENGKPFEVDVVATFQAWVNIDESLRGEDGEIKDEDMSTYHQAAVEFVEKLSNSEINTITVAEALDFMARLREQYDELAIFFRPKSPEERVSPDTSAVAAELTFSEEDSVPLMN